MKHNVFILCVMIFLVKSGFDCVGYGQMLDFPEAEFDIIETRSLLVYL